MKMQTATDTRIIKKSTKSICKHIYTYAHHHTMHSITIQQISPELNAIPH